MNALSTAPINVQSGNFWLSISRTFGAFFSLIPFRYLPRRPIFLAGHILMGICLALSYEFVRNGQPDMVVLLLCCFMIAFQSSMGSGFFMYIAEVGTEPAMGLSLCCVMICSIGASALTPYLISLPGFGVVDIMLSLAVLQMMAVFCIFMWMKETAGLSLA